VKQRVAIIGTGIAGMAAAYYLRTEYDVTLIEKNNYVGGHTNTVSVSLGGDSIPVDTGFMVYNDTTYPHLVRLFEELGVTSYDTSMSFGVRNVDRNLEYACSGFSTFFAQRKNLINPVHWKLYRDILKFFRAADALIADEPSPDFSLSDFAGQYALSSQVMNDFVLPMAGAIWSTPGGEIRNFPALPLLRFMKNHQMLGVGIQLQWKTVEGGSNQYKEKLLAALPNKTLLSQNIKAIGQDASCAYFYDEAGNKQNYDFIIVATHADQALRLLESPSSLQSQLLSAFQYNKNHVKLHSDASVMPHSKQAWASWNVLNQTNALGESMSSTHYWMNSLQNLDTKENLFVSVDYPGSINPEKTYWQARYEHPRFDAAAISAQPRLPELNASGKIRFCGSYFRNGFHEDALWSALSVVDDLSNHKKHHHELVSV
jgi:predicted NAD/FAD-binding protein